MTGVLRKFFFDPGVDFYLQQLSAGKVVDGSLFRGLHDKQGKSDLSLYRFKYLVN